MITFNNIEENGQHDVVGNILTFTEIPNILKVETDGSLGTQAVCILSFDGNLRSTVSADSQYYITILGETITNVMSPSDANNKRFFIDDDEDCVAMSVARAFRNCGSIAADFNIIFSGSYVKLYAKTVGQKWQRNPVSTNIASQYLNVNYSSGGTSSSIYTNGKIDVDVYSGDSSDDSNYVTTLEKTADTSMWVM